MPRTKPQYSSKYKRAQSKFSALPDVALEAMEAHLEPLPWVGMSQIEMPLLWRDQQESALLRVPAQVDAWVSLDLKPARGIHMSRLYLSVQQYLAEKPLSGQTLSALTEDFLKTHQELSTRARVAVKMSLPVRRKSLKSENRGWRNYPFLMVGERGPLGFRLFLEVKIVYSSTCPASAALSRQMTATDFLLAFPEGASPQRIAEWLKSSQGMPATPHAQRSEARVHVEIDPGSKEDRVLDLIDLIEETLQTPVQAAVKREDEQEFARLNGQNLMFCEDAARRVRVSLESSSWIMDYFGRFRHFESLHPHNAVSFIQKSSKGLGSFSR